jgi:2-polyprenyl-6-hydroxyphenyl methylase/3-demethylubiquinone-9 3-methyltransferase
MDRAPSKSVNPSEIRQFTKLADEWWSPNGAFRPLHQMNPARLTYIRDQVCNHFQRDHLTHKPLEDLRIVDIGCGGGLLTEPLHRLGANVMGVDAGVENIEIAKAHAELSEFQIDYQTITAEALSEKGNTFDVIISMEVIEHVANLDSFLSACCRLINPNGVLILSTLNRTVRSFALGIVAAEYILRWVARGTHEWGKFVKPSELASLLRKEGVVIKDLTGMHYNPWQRDWALKKNIDVNYLAFATKGP